MSQVDLVILFLAVALPLLWWFRESLPFIGGKPAGAADASLKRGGAGADDEGDPRDFVGKMERGVSTSFLSHSAVSGGRRVSGVVQSGAADIRRWAGRGERAPSSACSSRLTRQLLLPSSGPLLAASSVPYGGAVRP